MGQITKFIIIMFVFNCCSRNESNKKKIKVNQNKKYDIESIDFWGSEKDTNVTPRTLLKIDTINWIGMEVSFAENGDTLEKCILIDKNIAYRLLYYENKIYLANFCYYDLHRVQKDDYSMVKFNYGLRTGLSGDTITGFAFVKGSYCEGLEIDLYENKKLKTISYYTESELNGEKIYLDSINGEILKYEFYKMGVKMKEEVPGKNKAH